MHAHAVDRIDLLTEVWTANDDEDRMLAEKNHRCILSRTYRPGSLAPSAFMLLNILEGDAGGATRWLHDTLMPCATRQARSPRGHVTLDLLAQKRLAAVSGRSGATPMLAMLDHLTRTAPLADVDWLHAARDPCRVLFAAELAQVPMPKLTVSRSSPVWSRLSRPHFEGTAFDRHS